MPSGRTAFLRKQAVEAKPPKISSALQPVHISVHAERLALFAHVLEMALKQDARVEACPSAIKNIVVEAGILRIDRHADRTAIVEMVLDHLLVIDFDVGANSQRDDQFRTFRGILVEGVFRCIPELVSGGFHAADTRVKLDICELGQPGLVASLIRVAVQMPKCGSRRNTRSITGHA